VSEVTHEYVINIPFLYFILQGVRKKSSDGYYKISGNHVCRAYHE